MYFTTTSMKDLYMVTACSWVSCPNPRPYAHWRLFCFPYAGGSARLYQNWSFSLPAQVEVCAIELPGRGRRMAEAPFFDLTSLIQNLGQRFAPWLDKPFACFGHSLGGLVAFELVQWLRSHHQLEPQHLWVSAACAPHLPITAQPIHALPQAEFIAELRRYNGTPIAVLDNAELMELMLPMIRADFALLETYCYQTQPPLSCPITALWGKQDLIVSLDEMASWQVHTTGSFSLKLLSGDHFFVDQPQVLSYLQHCFDHTQTIFKEL